MSDRVETLSKILISEAGDSKLEYNTETSDYIVTVGNKSESFKSAFNPIFGPDIIDLEVAEKIASRLEKEE